MALKKELLEEASMHAAATCEKVASALVSEQIDLQRRIQGFNKLSSEQKIVENKIIPHKQKRIEELKLLKSSPYFSRLDFVTENESEKQIAYIGKFGLSKENIYSWTTPIAALRFEKPGKTEYLCPTGSFQEVDLGRKDQLMIVDGKIKFLATESKNKERELVYQEHFSNRKSGFVLPEIVAEMEKAQDQVIRADYFGPFVISGPAGSGKTTLALHRVAYLLQAPDLGYFKDSNVLVLVQDNGTKDYFSKLLPELGIDNVLITTFAEWSLPVLAPTCRYTARIGDTEEQRDKYEYAKLNALRKLKKINFRKDVYGMLEDVYANWFDEGQKGLFQRQEKENVLDHIDLIILLSLYKESKGSLGSVRDYYIELKNGTYKKKNGFIPFDYSLIIIDEFQNYLPEQLRLIKECINKKTKSVVYVGDMAQQVRLGTVKSWEEIGEKIEEDRKVVLQKVYRNTREIVKYIKSLGYNVEVPKSLKNGKEVIEKEFINRSSELNFVRESLQAEKFGTAGIIAFDDKYLEEYKRVFAAESNIHVMTVAEAQGVEFDTVFMVGIHKNLFSDGSCYPEGLRAEIVKIKRDLLYVGLTRAISSLYVLGGEKLSKII